jgi:hypothetical protein
MSKIRGHCIGIFKGWPHDLPPGPQRFSAGLRGRRGDRRLECVMRQTASARGDIRDDDVLHALYTARREAEKGNPTILFFPFGISEEIVAQLRQVVELLLSMDNERD